MSEAPKKPGENPPTWESIERDLDALLDLDDSARTARIEEIRAADAAKAELLGQLLAEATQGSAADVARFASLVDAPEPAAPPERIGPFEITDSIARGGMGEVFLAKRVDGGFEQIVALKLLRQDWSSAKAYDRFLSERQLLADLHHPNIAQLIDGGITTDGRPFFALEYVDGQPITEASDTARLTLAERLDLFDRVLDAVAHAHQKLVVHRDLKPANIFVSETQEVKLLDFGIAKLLDDSAAKDETATVERVLTPAYAAPEQLLGEPITTATDVYGLGMVLYELLSGQRPFPDRVTSVTALRDLDTDPVPMSTSLKELGETQVAELATRRKLTPRSLRRSLLGDLDAVVARSLRRDPAQRYTTVNALRADLERSRSGKPVVAARGNWIYKTSKTWKRHWPAFLAAALVTGSLAVGLWVSIQQTRAARLAEAKSEAVNRFLTRELLGAADPTLGHSDLTLRQVVEATERTVGSAFRDQPGLEASIRRTLGSVRLSLGDTDAARQQIDDAVALFEESGSSPKERAEMELLIAELELQANQFAKARAAAESSLALFRESQTAGHPDAARSQLLLARIDIAEANPILAERRLRNALADLDPTSPEGQEMSLELQIWLADALEGQAIRTESIEILEHVLRAREAELGPDHPKVADILGPLAVTRARLDKSSEAEPLALRALQINRSVFGDLHPRTLASVHELTFVLVYLNREADARDAVRPWLPILEKALNEGSPAAIKTLNNLAIIERRLGNDEQAEILYHQALAASLEHFGSAHDRTMAILRNLSDFLARLGQIDEASELARQVQQHGFEEAYEEQPDAIYLAQVAWFLARTKAIQPRELDSALSLAQRSVSVAQGAGYYPWVALSEVHHQRGELKAAIEAQHKALEYPDVLHHSGEERYLVRLYSESGDSLGAEAFLREHLVRRQEARKADDPLIGHTLSLLGRNLLAQDRPVEAEEVLRQSLAIFERRSPPTGDPWQARALSDLGQVLADTERSDEARDSLDRGLRALEDKTSGRWLDERLLLLERRVKVAEMLGQLDDAQRFEDQVRQLASDG